MSAAVLAVDANGRMSVDVPIVATVADQVVISYCCYCSIVIDCNSVAETMTTHVLADSVIANHSMNMKTTIVAVGVSLDFYSDPYVPWALS